MAELDGDHERAAWLWEGVLDHPHQFTYALQWIARARNLHAIGETAELAEVCKRIAEPPVFRDALLAGRAQCKAWGAWPTPTNLIENPYKP